MDFRPQFPEDYGSYLSQGNAGSGLVWVVPKVWAEPIAHSRVEIVPVALGLELVGVEGCDRFF